MKTRKQFLAAVVVAILFGVLFTFFQAPTGQIAGAAPADRSDDTGDIATVKDVEIERGILIVLNETVSV